MTALSTQSSIGALSAISALGLARSAQASQGEATPRVEADLTSADWQTIHLYRNLKAQLRWKRLSARLRDVIPLRLVELEAQARDRGIWAYCGQARAYPDRERSPMCGARVVDGDVQHVGPPRRPRKPVKPNTVAPAAAMDSLEDQLRASLARQRENGRVDSEPARDA